MLSFDIEEFDMPCEYGARLPFDEQISVSATGTRIILDILRHHKINATFFSTVVFASEAKSLIQRIVSEGHELASHGCSHSSFKNDDLLSSRVALEKMSGATVAGFRMPRMKPVDDRLVREAGYIYNSSLNPTYLPGRYNNFFKARTVFTKEGLATVPASVTPILRFPLFWLSFHNVPLAFYKLAAKFTMYADGYLNLYFHPWEFTDLSNSKYGLPKFVSRNSGGKMIERFQHFLCWSKAQGYQFETISQFVQANERGNPL